MLSHLDFTVCTYIKHPSYSSHSLPYVCDNQNSNAVPGAYALYDQNSVEP